MRVVFEVETSDAGMTDTELSNYAKGLKYKTALVLDMTAVQVIREDGTIIEVEPTTKGFCDDPDCDECAGEFGDGHHY